MKMFRFGKTSGLVRAASLVASLVILSANTLANEPCSATQSQKADAAIDTLHSWNSLYKWYRLYVQCDDGSMAEGVSEAVVRNFIDRWGMLPELSQLAAKSTGFRSFVLKHIDETLNLDDVKKIQANASMRCPPKLHSLCESIKKQADNKLGAKG